LFHSVERKYVIKNLPWYDAQNVHHHANIPRLIGSIGTIAEDAVIFVQFRLFRARKGEAIETA
jgi:solute carrier family 66 (lysosomal lysine-arginine transporter), member 1